MEEGIIIKQLSTKPIINEFDHHRFSLYNWYVALKDNKIEKNSFLLFIDQHDDFAYSEDELITEFIELDKNNLSEVKNFVTNKLRSDNSDFIRLAMEDGLVGDCLMITDSDFSRQGDCRYKDGVHTFIDKKGREHKIFVYPSTLNLEGGRGLFTDHIQHMSKEIRKSIHFDDLEGQSILLDVDLDYFSIYKGGIHTPVHDNFFDRFFEESPMFRDIICDSNVINFALEPGCCGGRENMEEIRKKLYKKIQGILDIAFISPDELPDRN